jgi:hypothetical protein
MAINMNDIQRGMEVIAIDGERIGKVVEVRPPTAGDAGAGGLDATRGYGMPRDLTQRPPGTTTAAGSRENQPHGGQPAGEGLSTVLDDEAPRPHPGYILVQDDGVLGVDARRLHLPFSSVLDVVPGRRIAINCSRDDAAMRYGHGPSLDIDEDAEVTPF